MSDPTTVDLSPEAVAFADWFQRYQVQPSEVEVQRALVESNHELATEPENVTYRDVDANGVPAIWVEPIGANTDYVILHIHNGGSVFFTAQTDRKPAGHIAAATGVPSLVLTFRRAPEHKYPAQLDDVESAYEWLIAQGYAPENIIALGHSIGGYLSTALALRLRDAQKPMPGVVVSISPWADLTISNETMESLRSVDKLLSKELLEFFREAWIGGTGIANDDPQINLIRTDLSGLPPVHLSWGTYEVLAGEDEIFGQRLREAGVDVTVMPLPGLQHSYVAGAGKVPEVDAAIAEIAGWIVQKLDIPR